MFWFINDVAFQIESFVNEYRSGSSGQILWMENRFGTVNGLPRATCLGHCNSLQLGTYTFPFHFIKWRDQQPVAFLSVIRE